MSMEKDEKPNQTRPNRYANPRGNTAWARAGATSAFKAINPELFIKPNKVTTVIGLTALTGCVAFIGYMHAQNENRKDLAEGNAYKAVDEDGKYNKVVNRTSRWN